MRRREGGIVRDGGRQQLRPGPEAGGLNPSGGGGGRATGANTHTQRARRPKSRSCQRYDVAPRASLTLRAGISSDGAGTNSLGASSFLLYRARSGRKSPARRKRSATGPFAKQAD